VAVQLSWLDQTHQVGNAMAAGLRGREQPFFFAPASRARSDFPPGFCRPAPFCHLGSVSSPPSVSGCGPGLWQCLTRPGLSGLRRSSIGIAHCRCAAPFLSQPAVGLNRPDHLGLVRCHTARRCTPTPGRPTRCCWPRIDHGTCDGRGPGSRSQRCPHRSALCSRRGHHRPA